ncbi:MAG: selenide, water dikinase SelD, partial [Deltaproteobacteria bacterium]|nr:selenide, water dikinase SelD [Deltaproteobacteria bacterium]
MAEASNVTLEIFINSLPIRPEALDMYKNGLNTGMNRSNQSMVQDKTLFQKELPAWHQEILFDPQTSGGLLIAVPEKQGSELIEAFKADGMEWISCIGGVLPYNGSDSLVFL